ncbi:mitochondria-eating protein isoform X2 [Ambystoma mexicanum]|uniref:mitochondria-eating protein isoform X2 n=1 Tax=Ambystoma mexicanum TaxID=8296 RepID=UPI0037E97F3E
MADLIRRLKNAALCALMQEKLDDWHRNYHANSCDENLNSCCELMELSSNIQGQLFTILNTTAREGGQYAGVDTLKKRLLPHLSSCFSTPSSPVSPDNSVSLFKDSLGKERKIRELANCHEQELQKLETQLLSTRLELGALKKELSEANLELQDTKTKSATTLLATEDEIMQLKSELSSAQDHIDALHRKQDTLEDCERQIRHLKDDIAILSSEKCILQGKLSRSRSPSPTRHDNRSSSPQYRKSDSPTVAMLTNSSRHARLVSRFSDIFANDRLDAQNLLRRYIEDLEMVQRIIFIATLESFHAAKTAFRQFKLRVRKSLSPTHSGPESLEDVVIDYIVRNLDLYDVQASVSDVIRAMNVNPKISFPPEVDFILISSFIREVCRTAFAMQTLDTPIDVAFSSDGELYSESKYRRSYDSDYTAPLVVYHVWPALMENDCVLVKGEVVTKRGALWSPGKRRSRSCSPVRSRSVSPCCSVASRSRSPSPMRRSGTPI